MAHVNFIEMFDAMGQNQMISLSDLGDRIFYTGRVGNLPENIYKSLEDIAVIRVSAVGFDMTTDALIRLQFNCRASYTVYGGSQVVSFTKA